MHDYKAKAKEMAKARLEKMGGKSSDRADKIMRASGGRVCKADGGSMMHDEPDGDEFDSGAEIDGEGSKPRLDKPSRGAGKTTVNIIVGKGQEAPPAPMAAMPMPPPPPPAPPVGAGPMPPMPMRAAGGRMTAGAATGEGRLEKAEMARKHK